MSATESIISVFSQHIPQCEQRILVQLPPTRARFFLCLRLAGANLEKPLQSIAYNADARKKSRKRKYRRIEIVGISLEKVKEGFSATASSLK
jgi:hypothetical protein